MSNWSNKITPVEEADQIEMTSAVDKKEENLNQEEERDNWSGKLDFFMSALSFSVGLGAVWRFPYLCYKNGGGAFLIPSIIFLFLLGIPLMYMELSIGQFSSRGPTKSWVMVSIARGIGLSTTMITNYLGIYYIMIIGYSYYYLFLSLRSTLPWETCNPKWRSPNCVDNFDPDNFTFTNCFDPTDDYKYLKCKDDGKCYMNTSTLLNPVDCTTNKSELDFLGYWNPAFPSENYWNKVVLEKTDSIDDIGGIVWQLVIALFVAWLITFLSVFRGVKLSGKIVYFTALFPYLVLLILGIRGVLLDGAGIGIEYYIKPDPKKLLDLSVWKDAAVQVFFSLSLSYGGLIALSSYNKFNHNCLRDAFFLTISNFLTCILAGFVVFAYMGALSKASNIAIDNVVQGGQGLVFIVYPYAATTLSAAPLWSVMFFIMMIALGMGTQMAAVQTLVTSLEDFFPVLKKTALIKAGTLAVICLIFFCIGLLFTTRAGTYWIELFDTYSANWAVFLIAIFQCVCVAWLYGINRYKTDVSAMIPEDSPRLAVWSERMFHLWRITWQFVTPVLLFALFIFSWIDLKPINLDEYIFPKWTVILGNILTSINVFGILGWIFYQLYLVAIKRKTFKEIISPSSDWRPSKEKDYQRWLDIKQNAF